MLPNILDAKLLTQIARQYGEVVLPDASTGQSPDTLARKHSRCKEGMAQVLMSRDNSGRELRVLRYKFDAIDEKVTIYNLYALQWRGPGFIPSYEAVLGAGAKAKLVTILTILFLVYT